MLHWLEMLQKIKAAHCIVGEKYKHPSKLQSIQSQYLWKPRYISQCSFYYSGCKIPVKTSVEFLHFYLCLLMQLNYHNKKNISISD